ncbi:MAG: YihY/virulence factor BrkB family protein [Chloroflexi bacterium]|nr:YihY/virulence factor BrkB family protein [Chloroflexota bacterium]
MGKLIGRMRRSCIGRFYKRWTSRQAGEGAILIAWQALFSLFPLILGLLSIFGLVLRDPERRAEVTQALAGAIASQFPSQLGSLLSFLDQTREIGGLLGIVSLIGLLWSGSNLFGAMGTVFDRVYGAPDRGFVGQRLISFAMMAVYAVLLPLSVAAGGAATFVVGLSEQVVPFEVPYSTLVSGWLVSLLSATLMFLVVYRVVPNVAIGFRDVWPGAVLAGVLFVALSQVFPVYLGYMGGNFQAYKTLGALLLLMTWLYVLALILVAGALVNATLSGHCPVPAPNASPTATDPADHERDSRRQRTATRSAGRHGTIRAPNRPDGPACQKRDASGAAGSPEPEDRATPGGAGEQQTPLRRHQDS